MTEQQNQLVSKASILMEALPYIRRLSGKTIVIKYGGAAMVDPALRKSFAKDITLLKYIGINPIIVHGGGPQIGQVLEKMGIESKFHNGMRITDKDTMDVVEMVLVGKVNKEIVGFINQNGGQAVGLSGKDGGLIQATKLPKEKVTFDRKVPEIIDLGRVGRVKAVNPQVLELLDTKNFIPVIAPVGVDDKGQTLNINADLVAGALAAALKAEKLVLLTDVEGVLDKDGNIISEIKGSAIKKMMKEESVTGGMIPKLESVMRALEGGVKSAHIINGRVQHAALLEIFTDKGVGTIIQ